MSCSDFTFIFGALATCMCLVPSFRNMRMFSFLALVGTTYTSWYAASAMFNRHCRPAAWARLPLLLLAPANSVRRARLLQQEHKH